MKTLKWNLGIMVIWFGYKVRGGQDYKQRIRNKLMWFIGRYILKIGYKLRGGIPQKRWKWNYVNLP